MEETAGGSEAELPELQTPDTFVEAMEEKTGVELDLSAVDPEALAAEEAEIPETSDDSENTETTEENGNNPEGFEWGNRNGEVPSGQNVDVIRRM